MTTVQTSRARKPSPLSQKNDAEMAAKGFVRAIRAARRIGVVPSTIYNWARAGDVATEKRGFSTYVSIQTLLAKLGPEQALTLRVTSDPKSWS